MSGQTRQILTWPSSYETYRKIPTCILYSQRTPSEPAQVLAWGLEAKSAAVQEGMGLYKCVVILSKFFAHDTEY